MSEDQLARLYTTIPDAQVWRIRRINDPTTGQRIGPFLTFGRFKEDGSDQNEWLLEEFTPQTVFDRWGTGIYALELFAVDDRGAHAGKGRSKYFFIDDDAALQMPEPIPKPNPLRPAESPPPRAEFRPDVRAEPSPAHAPPENAAMPGPRMAMDPDLLRMLQLSNYINERADRIASTRVTQEREMASFALQNQQTFFHSMLEMKQGGRNAPVTREEIAEIVRMVVREELAEEEEEPQTALVNGQPGLAAPTGDAAVITKSIENIVNKLMPLVASALHGRNAPGGGAASQGGD